MRTDIDQVLLHRGKIARQVARIGRRIIADLAPLEAPDRPLEITLVPILTGSFIFVADLIRRLPLRMQIRLISVSSYPDAATASQGARIDPRLTLLPARLDGAHVLVIDDILDSGNTLRLVTQEIARRGPASLRTCVLLRKQRPAALRFPVDYVCFDIPDQFVVGYGLDWNNYYRNLPDIVTLHRHVLEAAGPAPAI